jgi:type III restriction enzyme
MALHPDFPGSPFEVPDPRVRWFPADESLREKTSDKLMPPLVPELRRKVAEFRRSNYVGAADTSRHLLKWWFHTPHLIEKADGSSTKFRYYFSQREAIETLVYLNDVACVQDRYDLVRFDSSGAVSPGMIEESWRRFVFKMATGAGKTKVMSLAIAWSFFHKVYEPDSSLARNFLVIAPNIIVLDRVYNDFEGQEDLFSGSGAATHRV